MVALIKAKRGDKGRIWFIRAGFKRRKMLRRMGVFEGALIEVISDAGPGGMWVRTNKAQISLTRNSTGDIFMVFIV